MKILLDTHTFLWALLEPEKLSLQAKNGFQDIENELYLSIASYWEICIKVALDKLRLVPEWKRLFTAEMRMNGILWLAISNEHCEGIIDLPMHHRDPFDRLLIAQAQREEMSLLTADHNMAKYDVSTIW